jgi:hypothetical protein
MASERPSDHCRHDFAGNYSLRASSSSVCLPRGKGWPTRLRTIVREFCAVRICVWKPADTL